MISQINDVTSLIYKNMQNGEYDILMEINHLWNEIERELTKSSTGSLKVNTFRFFLFHCKFVKEGYGFHNIAFGGLWQ